MPREIRIFDTTLRDGEQMPGVNLGIQEKLDIARQLERMGVSVIEAGFPAASPGDFECVKAVADAVKNSVVTGLSRCVKADIDRAWEALKGAAHPRLHLVMATSEIHMRAKYNLTPEQVLTRITECVRHAKGLCPDVQFSAEDASRSDTDFLCRAIRAALSAGATVINIPDTVGYAYPEEFGALFKTLFERVPELRDVDVAAHCHNDLGMAVANALEAARNGATQLECTVNGLGERAGNASLEELVMAIHTRGTAIGLTTAIDTARIYRVSRLVSSLTGVGVTPTKPIVGENAFRHESGIHQHGMLRDRNTYEIMTPASIGLSASSLVLGKHSGRHAFAARLDEMGYRLEPSQIDEAFDRFKRLCDRKKDVSDRDIEALIEQQAYEPEAVWELDAFQLQSGNGIMAMACVRLKHEGEVCTEAAVGDGPVNAVFNAIERLVGRTISLESYGIKAVTEGADALGEVTVRIALDGRSHTGRGLATDILEASARAYLNAINRALS